MSTKAADGFVWYELVTNDLEKATAFYKSVVGWDFHDAGMPGITYMLFGKDGKDVGGMMSWSGMGMTGEPEWMGHIHTADLDGEVKSIADEGGSILRPPTPIPGIGRFAVVLDPQKAKYLLFEPATEYAPPRLPQMALGNVTWHELITTDSAKAWDFYSRHYGWQKDYAHDMGPMGIYQTFRTTTDLYTGGMMDLSAEMSAQLSPKWVFYFAVDDIEAAQKRVTDAGGKVVLPPMDVPGGSRVMQALDDQGCHFALIQSPK